MRKKSRNILHGNLKYIVPFWDLAGILLLIYPVCCETPFKKMLAVRMYSKNGFVYNTLSGKQSWEVINTVLLSWTFIQPRKYSIVACQQSWRHTWKRATKSFLKELMLFCSNRSSLVNTQAAWTTLRSCLGSMDNPGRVGDIVTGRSVGS